MLEVVQSGDHCEAAQWRHIQCSATAQTTMGYLHY